MGFLRNMLFSFTPQMVRQDPAWYALRTAGLVSGMRSTQAADEVMIGD